MIYVQFVCFFLFALKCMESLSGCALNLKRCQHVPELLVSVSFIFKYFRTVTKFKKYILFAKKGMINLSYFIILKFV